MCSSDALSYVYAYITCYPCGSRTRFHVRTCLELDSMLNNPLHALYVFCLGLGRGQHTDETPAQMVIFTLFTWLTFRLRLNCLAVVLCSNPLRNSREPSCGIHIALQLYSAPTELFKISYPGSTPSPSHVRHHHRLQP